MRKITYSIIAFLISNLAISQNCQDCFEDKSISTNPADPENCEMDLYANGKNNQFLNLFNWGAYTGNTFLPVTLNPNAGWLVPSYTTGSQFMQSPYNLGYLKRPNGTPIKDYDYQWEDGWELMFMNTGYWPDGNEYDVANSTNMINYAVPLASRRVPYIVLYNRYSGKMRFLFNVFSKLGDFQDISLEIGYISSPLGSGVFRHGNSLDRALDQETITPSFSTHFLNSNNLTSWYMADIQLGYDPCVCEITSEFEIFLRGVEESKLALLARGISVNRPLQVGGQPTYTDYLNISADELTSNANGALIYKTLDGMIDEYKKNLDIYHNQLNDYNTLGAQLHRNLYDLTKQGLNTGFQSVIPASVYHHLGENVAGIVGSFKGGNGTKADSAKYSKQLSKQGKAALGNLSDQLFVSIIKKPTKPTKPTMPVASFSEMRIKGTLKKESRIVLGYYPNPGSLTANNGVFDPVRYPIYNKPVGLFALLETPSLVGWQSLEDKNYWERNHYHPFFKSHLWYKKGLKTSFKLKSSLQYKFNDNVDIDKEQTEIYGQYRIEISKNFNHPSSSKNLQLLEDNNLIILHEFDDKIILQSDWYPIEILGEIVASTSMIFDHGWINKNKKTYEPILEKVQLTLMADIYFESLGSDGREKNTTQVFTYELYNREKEVDLIAEKGSWESDKREVQKFTPGTIEIKDEVIKPSSDFVWDVVGNEIHIKAEYVNLQGKVGVQPGYKAIIEAFWEIEVDPTVELDRIQLEVKKDFYGFPEPSEVTLAELKEFCGNDQKYKAKIVKEGIINPNTVEEKNDTVEEDLKEMKFILFPNPTSEIVTINIQGVSDVENGTVRIFDLSGKEVLSKNIHSIRFSVDVTTLSKGVYFIEIGTKEQKKVKRFIKI